MKRLKIAKVIIAFAAAASAACIPMAQAEDTPTPTTPAPAQTAAKPAPAPTAQPSTGTEPQTVPCKVLVVDRVAKTMTVEVEGKLHLIKVDPEVKIMKKGQLVTLQDIVSGMELTLLARTLPNGSFEVVSISADPVKSQTQPAGQGSGKALGEGRGNRSKDPGFAPFFNFPNPANNLGPTVSDND